MRLQNASPTLQREAIFEFPLKVETRNGVITYPTGDNSFKRKPVILAAPYFLGAAIMHSVGTHLSAITQSSRQGGTPV